MPTSPERAPVRAKRGTAVLAAGAVLCAGLVAGCGGAAEERPGDILLVTIDTLRADHLGIYGYERATSPELDAWFAEGAIFERAYSTEASTTPSVVSLLSGLLPQEHGVRLFFQLLPEDLALLPDRLPVAYQTAAVVSNMVLTDEATGLAAHFDHYDDLVAQRESRRRFFERDARRTTDAALAWLRESADPTRPLLLWVHYIDPHGPYAPPEEAPRRFTHEGRLPIPEGQTIPSYGRIEGVDDALDYVDRYDAEIAYTDREVGRLLADFDALRTAEDALLVLTADHGETMAEHERWFAHSYHVYEGIARVPLLLRGPGVERGRFDGLASGVDVLPTLLGFAGVGAAGLAGHDLRRGGELPPDRMVFVEASRKDQQWRAAVRGLDKWMIEVLGTERRTERRLRFDLGTDPGERAGSEAGADDPGVVRLLELVRSDPDPAGIPSAYREGMRLDAPKVAPGVDEHALEALRALGYADEE